MSPEREGAAADLRRILLDAARGILEDPDAGFDLRKIAERAGKSRTAPYLVFGKTEEGGGLAALRLAVAAEGFRDLVRELRSALGSAPDAEEGLEAMAAAYLAFARDHARLFRLMFGPDVGREMRRSASPPRPEHAELRTAHRRLEEVLIEAIARQDPGYVRRDRRAGARTVAGALWALLHGVATLTIDEQWGLTGIAATDRADGPDPDELARRTLRFLTTASSQALREAADALARARGEGMDALRMHEATPEEQPLLHVHEEEVLLADAGPDEPAALHERPPMASGSPGDEERAHPSPAEPFFASFAVSESAPRYLSANVRRTPSSSALRRAREHIDLAEGARIMWIDDRPGSVAHETAMLEGLGMRVFHARETRRALQLLRKLGRVDLILSDIEREGDPRAGVTALPRLAEASRDAPVVFYVAGHEAARPAPPGAFGITNDPDELLHLVFDVLERGRGAG